MTKGVASALAPPPPPAVLYVAEPPAVWRQRDAVVADCSVMAAFVFDEPDADTALRLLADKAVHAPTLLPYEIANVGRSKLKAGADPKGVADALRDYVEQRVLLHAIDPETMAELAARFALTAYDAAYLCLAERLRAPLATFDRRLAEAAGRHLGDLA